MGISLELGSSRMGAKLVWGDSSNPQMNSHMYVSGTSGMGKSTFLEHCIMQLPQQGVRVVVFDYAGEFQAHLKDKSDVSKVAYECYDVRSQVGVDLFPHVRDSQETAESSYEASARIMEMITRTYSLRGRTQRIHLMNALSDYMDSGGEYLTIHEFVDRLRQDEKQISKMPSAYAALQNLSVLLQSRPACFHWNLTEPGITLISFKSIRSSVNAQAFATQFLLSELWTMKIRPAQESSPVVLVLDEAQRLDLSRDSVCDLILREGRKYRLFGWFASQWIDDDYALSTLNQAGLKVYFNPGINNVNALANKMSHSGVKSKDCARMINSLKVGQFIYLDAEGRPVVCVVPKEETWCD